MQLCDLHAYTWTLNRNYIKALKQAAKRIPPVNHLRSKESSCYKSHQLWFAMIHLDKPWLAIMHSDKPWPLMWGGVVLICLYGSTGSLKLWEFIILFCIFQYSNDTLAIIWERNSVTGNPMMLFLPPHCTNTYPHF